MNQSKAQNTIPPIAETPGFIIELTAKRLKHAFQKALVNWDAGITADQWMVLNMLYEQDGISQFEIGQVASKDAPTVTRIIDLLVEKALLQRSPDPADRRRFKIHLTTAGKNKYRKLISHVRDFRLNHFNGLEDSDLLTLRKILSKIDLNIQKHKSL